MRVGILGPFPPFRGGIATFDAHLVRHMPPPAEAVGLNYHSLYPRWLFPGRTQFDESRQPFAGAGRAVFAPFSPWRWPAGWRALDQARLDILLLSWWTPLFAPSMRAFLSGWRGLSDCPLVAVCHNVRPHESLPTGGWWQRRLLRRADLLVAHARPDADQLQQWLPKHPVVHLFHPLYDGFPDHPGLDRAGARRLLGLNPDGPWLLFFGLIRPYKGLDVLLSAMELLPGVRLMVVGEFYEPRRRYQAALDRLRAAGRLVLCDRFVPNEAVAPWFLAADAVVLPYRSASQSGVVPLAYRWGRGVVTTATGGLPEVLGDGAGGELAPPNDPRGLAAAVERYLSRQSPVEAGLPILADRFSWGRYLNTLLAAVPRRQGGRSG